LWYKNIGDTDEEGELTEKNRARAVGKDHHPLSKEEQKKRKEQVLTQGAASVTQSIAEAVVMKNDNLYLVTNGSGNVPLSRNHGFGLYYNDCRYLNGYEFEVAGSSANVLVADDGQGFAASFEMTNPEIQVDEGLHIGMDDIGIRWERILDAESSTLYDSFTFRNYGHDKVEIPVTMRFRAEFEDVFAIRGLLDISPGTLHEPDWDGSRLYFQYDGADRFYRSLTVHSSLDPYKANGSELQYQIQLNPRETTELLLTLVAAESEQKGQVLADSKDQVDMKKIRQKEEDIAQTWLAHMTRFSSGSFSVNRVMNRSMRDLSMLRTHLDGKEYIAAGIPWFVALFGRDAAITAIQTLAYDPSLAEETIRVLAHYQGKAVNHYHSEEPGKILHELRVGELARLGEIPHTPYYGTVDATPLFLMLVARHASWSGDLSLFKEMKPSVEQAIHWIWEYGDLDGDGYIEYHSEVDDGLVNQGWKDSGNPIVRGDGSMASPPIALVEAQAYVYQALISIAGLYELTDDMLRAEELRKDAADLKTRFNRDFWMEEQQFFALALEKDKRVVDSVTSNVGHALWCGIVDDDKADKVVKRLMADDMFAGWGIRTLSKKNGSFNPAGYHIGSIWPFDNSIIAAGMRRYGYDQEAQYIFNGMVEAAMHFRDFRLPELFSGFGPEEYSTPVNYSVATHPQAWSAASVPYMLETLLGLRPEAYHNRLVIVRPTLPPSLERVEVRGLRVGKAVLELDFICIDNDVVVNVVGMEGEMDVIVE
jgi:glycogen debranching enzyme